MILKVTKKQSFALSSDSILFQINLQGQGVNVTSILILAHVHDHIQRFYGNCRTMLPYSVFIQ